MSDLYLSLFEIENIFKNHLKIETKVMSIASIFYDTRQFKKIDFSPYYQRNYVWDRHKATFFIESIFIGTEVPPLIFFKHIDGKIEVIDGRQRFETIHKFLENEFPLSNKGLHVLKYLKSKKFDKLPESLKESFLDTNIRIFEFCLIGEPPLDDRQTDLLKKEIFRRYNSGITPLKTYEIDKAVYIDEDLTQFIKKYFKNNKSEYNLLLKLLFTESDLLGKEKSITIEKVLQKIRQLLIIHQIPITYFASLKNKKEIFADLYEYLVETSASEAEMFEQFIKKIRILQQIQTEVKKQGKLSKIPAKNRLFFECCVWLLNILESEKFDLEDFFSSEKISDIVNKIADFEMIYDDENSFFAKNVIKRYSFTLSLVDEWTNFNKDVYLGAAKEFKMLETLSKRKSKLEITDQYNTLRLIKPDAQTITINGLLALIKRKNFLIRPSYQRAEVMNRVKASALIESILLSIKLPPVFVFKRKDRISEVIDGQQRLLAIIGFLGETFLDENGRNVKSEKDKFKLLNLKILRELEGKHFSDLSEELKDKIFDFPLYVVTIDEESNTNFNSIDLFIRLNKKPYPIKENSFEMWNSTMNNEIIAKIKENTSKHQEWFFYRLPSSDKRMENQELYTSLVYLFCKANESELDDFIQLYFREDRMNSKIKEKKDITKVLMEASTDEESKKKFIKSISAVEKYVSNLKTIILQSDFPNINEALSDGLSKLFGIQTKGRRTLSNFYLLWYILYKISPIRVKVDSENISIDIKKLTAKTRNVEEDESNLTEFQDEVKYFWEKYSTDERKFVLSPQQKKDILNKQGLFCPICRGLLTWGQDIHVDHIVPLSQGGKDELENMRITHAGCNLSRKKIPQKEKVKLDDDVDVQDYFNKSESVNLEFKSSLCWNIKAMKKDKEIEDSVLKTIAAFNNSDGGILLIGVDDRKQVVGLDDDFNKSGLINQDKFELHLRNIIKSRLNCTSGINSFLSKHLSIKFNDCEKKKICVIKVLKGKDAIYTNNDEFYIRSGNSTIKLPINEVFNYIQTHFQR